MYLRIHNTRASVTNICRKMLIYPSTGKAINFIPCTLYSVHSMRVVGGSSHFISLRPASNLASFQRKANLREINMECRGHAISADL